MKKTLINATLALTAGLWLSGCGGLSEEDVAKGWAATSMAVVSLQTTAARSAGETKTGTCAGGGTGDITVTTGESSSSFKVQFNDCGAQGVTISGPLEWTMTTMGTDASLDYTGDLTWTGDIDGDCEIAIKMATTGGVPSTYSGEICGYETGDVF